ncbi:hypothetical protein [Streptococcus pneumoniae]|uniref:hypothetical protein n=1 Tax=Streptococcus pneumoniae TaxID=1313 RepID=UPI00186ABC78|nr:hypothetical protein [Streptococcus pneumoniae]
MKRFSKSIKDSVTMLVNRTDEVSSKHGFEVVDETDEVSSKHGFEVVDETDEVSNRTTVRRS